MGADEPRVRRRGFFLHSAEEPDSGEHENPEGFVVRVRFNRTGSPRHGSGYGGRQTRGQATSRSTSADSQPAIRSGSVTGSRQRAHLPR